MSSARRYALACILTLTAATLVTVNAGPAIATTSAGRDVTVLENNIDGVHDKHVGRPTTVDPVIDHIRSDQPDVVLLNEVCFIQLRYLRIEVASLHYHFAFLTKREDLSQLNQKGGDACDSDAAKSDYSTVSHGSPMTGGFDGDSSNPDYYYGDVVGFKGDITAGSRDEFAFRGDLGAKDPAPVSYNSDGSFNGTKPTALCVTGNLPGLPAGMVKACVAHLDSNNTGFWSYDYATSVRKGESQTIANHVNPAVRAGDEVIIGGDLNSSNPATNAALDPLYSASVYGGSSAGIYREGDENDGGTLANAARTGQPTHWTSTSTEKYDYIFFSDAYADYGDTTLGHAFNLRASVDTSYEQVPYSDHLPYSATSYVGITGSSLVSSNERLADGLADINGDGYGDILATKPDGTMWLYPGNGNLSRPFTGGSQIGAGGWQGYDAVVAGDINGDHQADLVAAKPDGTLWLYPGNGSLTYPFNGGTRIGAYGWDIYDRIALGDINGDGLADLIATQPDGTMWLYPGNGSLTYPFSSATRIGASGWQGFDRVTLADVNGDRKADIIATKPDGTMWLYPGNGSLTYPFSSGTQIGASGWGGYDRILAGDVDGDGKADLVASKPTGELYLSPGNGSLSYPFSSLNQIGASGWQGFDRLI